MKYLNLLTAILVVVLLGCSEGAPVQVELDEAQIKDDLSTESMVAGKTPLWGETYALFNPGFFGDPTTRPSWHGTVTIDGTEYGLVFYSTGTGKPFAENVRGTAFFFQETYEIYSWANFDPETQTLTTGDLLIRGFDRGLVSNNSDFLGNGRVLEAYGDFAAWEGRHSQLHGRVEWAAPGLPYRAIGTFRAN